LLSWHQVDKLSRPRMASLHGNQDVGIENQRIYLGVRIFLSQA